MAVAGIIAEYNPLHQGHVYLMEETRRRLGAETGIVCVMSGDYVQRGDFALVGKRARAAAAVESGADLVVELPLPWAVSPAPGFALGAVMALEAMGPVTHLVFGSESGSAGALLRLVRSMDEPEFAQCLQQELRNGDSFAAAQQRAVAALLTPEEASLLQFPNNTLGAAYCRALLQLDSSIEPLAIPRVGAAHDSLEQDARFPSASAIRSLLRQGERGMALARMAPAMAERYRQEEALGRAPVFWETCQRAILARLRSMGPQDFAALDGGREGLSNRLFQAAQQAPTLEEVLAQAKTKRYALSRLRRMVLRAWLGLDVSLPGAMPYLRPLAANGAGRALLARMRKTAAVPILMKAGQVRRLAEPARRLFEEEVRAAGLYALAYPDLSAAWGGAEWRAGPVIL
ncbi:MAG: nucleotidyltransferase family protein [Oscillibacter sp.]|nr:nucleotidyltransferase family protein [Oscillibacter sp.]